MQTQSLIISATWSYWFQFPISTSLMSILYVPQVNLLKTQVVNVLRKAVSSDTLSKSSPKFTIEDHYGTNFSHSLIFAYHDYPFLLASLRPSAIPLIWRKIFSFTHAPYTFTFSQDISSQLEGNTQYTKRFNYLNSQCYHFEMSGFHRGQLCKMRNKTLMRSFT